MVGEQGKEEEIEIKVLETRVRPGSDAFPEWDEPGEGQRVVLDKAANAMVLRCADGCVLELRRLQSPGKKPVDAKSFGNGLGGRKLYWRSSFH
jgi:methionyl-tRNA formyltransferase